MIVRDGESVGHNSHVLCMAGLSQQRKTGSQFHSERSIGIQCLSHVLHVLHRLCKGERCVSRGLEVLVFEKCALNCLLA